ncbi:DUF2254 domain-containing protein [Jannaschia sp. R86511]|uniref:DUF2254 domain-containing protein n=1 Tax=Jannaschia sp. R86511 TaxID=3093853 RepID=UPI0036D2FB53
MRRFRLAHHLRTSLWVVPVVCVLAGVGSSLLTTWVDDGTMVPHAVTGDPTAMLQVLYLVSFAMLTLTGLVLSLVVVVIQLATGSFSPRIVREILQDRPAQVAVGLFVGTFTHSLLTMRRVPVEGDGPVPGLAFVVAVVLVLACLVTIVWFINHVGQSVRASGLVRWVALDTLATLRRVYPDPVPGPVDPSVVTAGDGGVVFVVGHHRLVGLAERADCRVELLHALGDFVPTGAPLARVVGDHSRLDPAAVADAVVLGPERTLNQDVAYGLRMLVDVAAGSVADGPFEDPTTSVQAIDRIHDLMRQIALRPLPDGRHRDGAGTVRLVVPTIGWEGLVRLAFEEVRESGAGSVQVTRRLAAALEDLLEVAPDDRRPALRRELELLREAAVGRRTSAHEASGPVRADASGIGSSPDLLRGPEGSRGPG